MIFFDGVVVCIDWMWLVEVVVGVMVVWIVMFLVEIFDEELFWLLFVFSFIRL